MIWLYDVDDATEKFYFAHESYMECNIKKETIIILILQKY